MITPAFSSTTSLTNETRLSIARIQAQLLDAQTELSSGRHADVGITLGATTGVAVSMRQDLDQIQSIKDSNGIVLTRMQASQAALDAISTNAKSFLSTLIDGQSSATPADTTFQQAQAGMQTLQDQLNSSLDGQYLFSGINSDVKPTDDFFADPPSASGQAVADAFQAKFGMSPSDPAVVNISASDMQDFLDNEFSDLFSDTNWSNNWSAASDKPVSNRIREARRPSPRRRPTTAPSARCRKPTRWWRVSASRTSIRAPSRSSCRRRRRLPETPSAD